MAPRKINKKDQPDKEFGRVRHITRLCAINVYSIANNLTAVQQFLEDKRKHKAVITETHIQENGYAEIAIEGYTIAGTCCREVGRSRGDVAIFARNTVPSCNEYNKIVQEPNELEHCAATVFPNHNPRGKLEIVGVYRPPEKDHPPYDEASKHMLRSNREENTATLILRDFNFHSWDTNEKGEYQQWVEDEQL